MIVSPSFGYFKHSRLGFRPHGESFITTYVLGANNGGSPSQGQLTQLTEEKDLSFKYQYFVELRDDVAQAVPRLNAIPALLAQKVVQGLN
jgi:hypothetical protein